MIAVRQNRPLWKWQDMTTNLVYEWSIQDIRGKTIWVDTIVGEGTTSLGSGDPTERIDILMRDISKKSFDAILSSTELDKFAASQHLP